MQSERADGEIEAAQTQRRQAEDQPEKCAEHGSNRQRYPEWRPDFADQHADGIGAGCQQARRAERNQSGKAGEQHQRQRADAGQQHLVGEIELKRRGDERQRDQRHERNNKPDTRAPRPEKASSCA